MKKLVLLIIGFVCLALGFIGMVLPFFPGIIFLLLALLCFAVWSPGLKRRLKRNPRMRQLFLRLDHGDGLHIMDRLKLTFWALLEAANPKTREDRR